MYSLGCFVSVRRILIIFEVVSHGHEECGFCLLYYKTVYVDRCLQTATSFFKVEVSVRVVG
jgi:hypothetical protein